MNALALIEAETASDFIKRKKKPCPCRMCGNSLALPNAVERWYACDTGERRDIRLTGHYIDELSRPKFSRLPTHNLIFVQDSDEQAPPKGSGYQAGRDFCAKCRGAEPAMGTHPFVRVAW